MTEPAREVTLPGGDTRELADDVGRVTIHDGVPHVCELGMALRLGLSAHTHTSELAAGTYPAFELLEDEERPEPGELHDGVPVFCWMRQDAAAILLQRSRRQVQNLETKGLPCRGYRETKRYPLPHIVMWMRCYVGRGGPDGRVRQLPFRVALAYNRLQEARLELRAAEGRL